MNYIAVFLAGLVGTFGFSIIFHISFRRLPFAVLGGAITCGALIGMTFLTDNLFFQNFVAAMCTTIYAEILSRILHIPVTVILLPSLTLLAPGGKLYYAMSYLVQGEQALFVSYALEAVQVAIGIAVGIVVVSVLMRLVPVRKKKERG